MSERMKIPSDWTFRNSEVAKNFDRHVREQLPWYDMLTRTIGLIARHYIQHKGVVYDIGCSTGNIAKELEEVIVQRQAQLFSLDNSPAMQAEYSGCGKFILADAVEHDYQEFDLAILFLVVQFIPLSERKNLLTRLMKKCRYGGAVILVDKYYQDTDSAYIQSIKRKITLLGKTLTGTPAEEILQKELSLSGVQRPLDFTDLFAACGIRNSEFFRFGEFAGWIITSDR